MYVPADVYVTPTPPCVACTTWRPLGRFALLPFHCRITAVKSADGIPCGVAGCQLIGRLVWRMHVVGATSVVESLAHSKKKSPGPLPWVVMSVPAITWGEIRFVAVAPDAGAGDV